MRAFDFPSGAQTRGREKQEQDALTSAAIRGDILDLASALLLPDVRLRLHKRSAWYDPAGIVRGQCTPNLQGPFRRTSFPAAAPLHLPVLGGPIQAVEMMINAGATVLIEDGSGRTPLHIAAMFRDTAMASLLLLHGARIDATDRDQVQPLFYAAFHVETDMAVLLLDHALRLTKCEAFAMGHHERLGAESMIVDLDPEVVRMIVERI